MGTRNSAFLVIYRRDHVLLVKAREKRRWSLPGGTMKVGETPWQAALREAEEETGLAPELIGLSGMYVRDDGSLVYVFAARARGDVDPAGPRHEIEKQRWMGIRKALTRLSDSGRRRLQDALALRSRTVASISSERFALRAI